MNSYIRQAPIPAEQMHNSCIKDTQAWENAITLYEGPDPLDHWYNYVCWYENHGHCHSETKFREMVEQCLCLYKDMERYKQDPRMVHLWIKYIGMQQNQLQLYQALYQRGIGRQVAKFYINWARCYEAMSAFKEAESVYNLGFRDVVNYEELQHAYSKFMYLMQTTHQAVLLPKPPQLQQQHSQPQQQQVYQQQPAPDPGMQQPNFRQVVFYQQQQPQPLQMQVPTQHLPIQQHYNYQQQIQQVQYQLQQDPHSVTEINSGISAPTANYTNTCDVQIANNTQAVAPVEQQLLATAPQIMEPYQRVPTDLSTSAEQQEEPHQPAQEEQEQEEEQETPLSEIKLPRKFASYCRNNHETWKPALFLEEPTDPSRHCHYAKSLVYPGTGIEYSPEELRARKFATRLMELKQTRIAQSTETNTEQPQSLGTSVPQMTQECQLQHQQLEPNQPHYSSESQLYNLPASEHDRNNSERIHYAAADEVSREVNDGEHSFAHQKDSVHELVSAVNADDLEEQIEASTIPCQNKPIKLKFKKERPRGGESMNGSNYSAYTIERIYQQDMPSPIPDDAIRRNGHSFHPYMLSQTSTPKTSSKRSKAKLKKANKFQVVGSSSNSSSAENGGAACVHEGTPPAYDNAIQNAAFNDNANYSFSSAVSHDNSNYSLASAVDHLHFRDTTGVANTGGVADFSTYQENSYFATQHDIEAKELRLQKAIETIERHFSKKDIDPFSSELCRAFLTKLDFPGAEDANYKILQTPLPKVINSRPLNVMDGMQFNIDKEVGRGSYGYVYKATEVKTGAVVALKYQKPPNTWEIYICEQVLRRIQSPNILPGLMDISTAVIAPNASLIGTEFSQFGSLLDINNKIRLATSKVMHESLVMHFSAQICEIVYYLHLNKIIHADLKPDNFLLMRIPNTDLPYPTLRLIDFGCAIDMTLFPDPDRTKFRKVIQTDGFTCIEMQEGRPWSYETDLFCIAGTVHVILLGDYMQLQNRIGIWDIKHKLPRYLKKHVWTKFFSEMLNLNAAQLPDLSEMRDIFAKEVTQMDSELQKQIRMLSNILYRR